MTDIQIKDLKIEGGTQPRCEIDESVVAEYAEKMKAGETFPPVVVFRDGANHWLADGFHRTHAARRVGAKKLPAKIHTGTKRDAILYSVGANDKHGKRRTPADKRKAVMTLLTNPDVAEDPKTGKPWSDREAARRCNVSHPFVATIRGELAPVTGNVTSEKSAKRTYTTKHGTTSTMNTENIGKSRIKNEYTKNGRVQKPLSARVEEIASLAAQGYRSDQIGDELGVRAEYVRKLAREHDITLPDSQIGKVGHVKNKRVIEQTVTGLEGYAMGIEQLTSDLSDIEHNDAAEWAESLGASIKTLNKLKRKLTEIANG